MHGIRIFVMTAIGLLPLASIAQECAAASGRYLWARNLRRPPVLRASGAFAGEVSCEAKEHGKLWAVRCTPESSTVRGGGGELEVDSISGKVKLVLGYR